MDMAERVQLLDREGMAKAILYPTLGLLWEAELMDPELSGAYCRAYNRWIADFCRDSGGRLIPIAHLSLGDPAAAARELERAVRDGCRGAFVCPFTITRVPHGAPEHDALFAAAQELDVPLAIHPRWSWNRRPAGSATSWIAPTPSSRGPRSAPPSGSPRNHRTTSGDSASSPPI